ncbi:RNA polymerase sigma factor [Arthrospiribacter ruber]|uniref:Sigma-70 family RNA polymerase sigma factor n=1 Tax=Arthrospiribacter ruber TaxID=2487934 RepID=A0A951MHT1_9BACT|nr:sigma-70 family RNA polymerase sigma factor [Arthrospiribacter ruber]MBW3469536.1 sigma-70 family RNA polymerase sigma factor [Arthrospiribacter ruber]
MKPNSTILPSQEGPNDFWLLLISGDRKGLEGLYKVYSMDLFRFGLSILPDEDFIQDCIQEVFIDLWKYHKTLQPANNVKVYIFKSLSRKISREINKEKKWNKEQIKESNTRDFYIESVEPRIIENQKEEDLKIKIAGALENLPPRQKEVILYLFFEDFSYEEVSKMMGINLRSVYTLAWKAISTLKKTFSSIILFCNFFI